MSEITKKILANENFTKEDAKTMGARAPDLILKFKRDCHIRPPEVAMIDAEVAAVKAAKGETKKEDGEEQDVQMGEEGEEEEPHTADEVEEE